MRVQCLVAILLGLLITAPAAHATARPLHKCGFHSVLVSGGEARAPVGNVRTRGIGCKRRARYAVRDWFDLFQNRLSEGKQVGVIYVLVEGKPNPNLRCVYRQSGYGPNGENPHAIVRCKAKNGYRLSFEGYA